MPGLEKIISARGRSTSIGFGAKVAAPEDRKAGEIFRDVEPEDLLKYGLIPEFVGRLPVVATLEDLDEPALKRILLEPKNALVKQYQRLFEMESIDFSLAEEALGAIARKAIERKTGARGLRSIMESILLDTMFDLPSLEGVEEVVISKEVVEGTARPLYIYADRPPATPARAPDASRICYARGPRSSALRSRLSDRLLDTPPPRLHLMVGGALYCRVRRSQYHSRAGSRRRSWSRSSVGSLSGKKHSGPVLHQRAGAEGHNKKRTQVMTTSSKPRVLPKPGEVRTYPVLPLRDIVVFPHMIVPLFVGREKSIKALEEVMRSDTFILLATQKNASDDDPATECDLRCRHPRERAATAQAARRHREGAGRGRRARARRSNTATAPNITRPKPT